MNKRIYLILSAVLLIGLFSSCKKDDDNGDAVKSRFSVATDEIDGFKVNITNDSENATSYDWNFGDGSTTGTQSDATFSYTYAAAGTYTITLTAKNGSETNVSSKEITISGMTLKQFLSGTSASGKVWHLEFNELINMFSPTNGQWWYGWNTLPTADQRNTVRHHEYIFKPDGSFEFKTKGYTVRPGTAILFGDAPESKGWADDVSWTSGDSKDCSTWGNNSSITFAIGDASKYTPTCTKRITLTGKGGHIGPMDTGTELVIGEPASETFYEIKKYAEGGSAPDTLILYSPWGGNENGVGTTRPGLGVIKLVSYKSDGQIPTDEIVATEKPLEVHDITETFETAGTMTWVLDNSPTEFVEDFANPVSGGINTSDHVGKYQRGTQLYANLQFVLSYRMNLSTRNVFKMKVYIDNAATVPTVALKLQDTKQGGNAWQTQTESKIQSIAKGVWTELTFDFSGVSTNTAYDKIVLQFGDEGTSLGDGLFYFDDLQLQ